MLFNIGAALFKLASECDRATGAGLGQAARYLQDAAGCFGYLRDHVALKLDAASRPEDISPEGCSLLEKTALAHAQQVSCR